MQEEQVVPVLMKQNRLIGLEGGRNPVHGVMSVHCHGFKAMAKPARA
jgi:hypothetical protein